MSYIPIGYRHTCDSCGIVQDTNSSNHPKGWNFLYQRADKDQPWCKELCPACLKEARGNYTEYENLMRYKDE